MPPLCVLIVEDEPEIRELVRYNLQREGFDALAVGSAQQALRSVDQAAPDLVLLDLMLPDMDGLAVCRRLKGDSATSGIPIIMLTARGEEADVVAGLNVGADDYIVKPFSPRVLLARIRAVFRRARSRSDEADPAEAVQVGDLLIHPGRHEALVAGQRIDLSVTEFRILLVLARRPGWVFTRKQILDDVHGPHCAVTDRAVDVQIVGLRKKLGGAGNYIETVRGVGYRFKE